MPSTWQTPQMAAYYGRQGGRVAGNAKRALIYIAGIAYTYRTLAFVLGLKDEAARKRVRTLRAAGRAITIEALKELAR